MKCWHTSPTASSMRSNTSIASYMTSHQSPLLRLNGNSILAFLCVIASCRVCRCIFRIFFCACGGGEGIGGAFAKLSAVQASEDADLHRGASSISLLRAAHCYIQARDRHFFAYILTNMRAISARSDQLHGQMVNDFFEVFDGRLERIFSGHPVWTIPKRTI